MARGGARAGAGRKPKPAAEKPKEKVKAKAPAPPPVAKPQTGTDRLDELGIDGLCSKLEQGETFAQIAADFEISTGLIHRWISKDADRSARAREAQAASAEAYAAKAESALKNAEATGAEIQRARELALHYRWMAAKRNPHRFGDKVSVEQTLNVTELTDDQLNARIVALIARTGLAVAADRSEGAAAAAARGTGTAQG